MEFFIQALQTKSDLLNFCLQILAIFLQLEETTDGQYISIYNSLLMPENWSQENQSLMSAYIQFLIAFIAKHKNKLIEDKGGVELILSKVIEIDHVELFYRFMEAIMINITLLEFAESGYLNLVVQGGQVISKTIQGRKATLIFFSKLILFYDTLNCLDMVNISLYRSTDASLASTNKCLKPTLTSFEQSPSEPKDDTYSVRFAELPISSTSLLIQIFPLQSLFGHSD